MTPIIRTHKASGWTRTLLDGMASTWRIDDPSGSGETRRIIRFLSRGSWANDANDRKEDSNRDRVVLLEGEPLPTWAVDWLTKANAKTCNQGREALQAALDDADWHESSRDGW